LEDVPESLKQLKPYACIPLKSIQKYFAKTLDKNRLNKYINKAPEEKRFTETRAEPRKKNSLKA
jgi:hypothetical protein